MSSAILFYGGSPLFFFFFFKVTRFFLIRAPKISCSDTERTWVACTDRQTDRMDQVVQLAKRKHIYIYCMFVCVCEVSDKVEVWKKYMFGKILNSKRTFIFFCKMADLFQSPCAVKKKKKRSIHVIIWLSSTREGGIKTDMLSVMRAGIYIYI